MGEIYSEVNEILNLLGKYYIDRLPKKLYDLILNSKNNEYQAKFKSIEEISINNCNKEAIDMIALFHLNYWCENQEERQELNKKLSDNYIKNEEEKRTQFNPDKIFKNHNQKQEFATNTDMEKYKEPIFKKIIKLIKRIFSRA